MRAGREQLPRLIENWNLVFGDSVEEIRRFYDAFWEEGVFLCICSGGEIVSQLALLPAVYRFAEKTVPAWYLYAALTRPEGRGRGLMGELVTAAVRQVRDMGAPLLFTLPASAGLYGYYARFGFATAFFRERGASAAWPAGYEAYRRQMEREPYCVVWGERHFSYAAGGGFSPPGCRAVHEPEPYGMARICDVAGLLRALPEEQAAGAQTAVSGDEIILENNGVFRLPCGGENLTLGELTPRLLAGFGGGRPYADLLLE